MLIHLFIYLSLKDNSCTCLNHELSKVPSCPLSRRLNRCLDRRLNRRLYRGLDRSKFT